MRAKNIFKVDSGIKCPFCRQYVDGYKAIQPPCESVQRFLAEANQAAKIAAAARAAQERREQGAAAPAALTAAPPSGAGSGGARTAASAASGAAAEDQTWNCGGCGVANYMWREFCGHCKRTTPHPYATDKISQTRKDLGLVSREELVGYLCDQGGFALRRVLRDMGVSLDGCRSYGSEACVREAVALHGLKRVLHIATLLADADTLRNASLSKLGNLGVQRTLESMAKLRTAFPADHPHPEVEAFKYAHGGRDPFAALLEALRGRVLEYCLHEKGVYVVQCACALASNAELVELGQAVFPLALVVARDPRGVFALLHLLDLLSQRIWNDAAVCEPALQAVDVLCTVLAASDRQVVHTAGHWLSGKVQVRAIAVSMPRLPALRLAVKIAVHAATLSGCSGGLQTLMELLQLYGHNQAAAEGLRDVATTMCYALQGGMAKCGTAQGAGGARHAGDARRCPPPPPASARRAGRGAAAAAAPPAPHAAAAPRRGLRSSGAAMAGLGHGRAGAGARAGASAQQQQQQQLVTSEFLTPERLAPGTHLHLIILNYVLPPQTAQLWARATTRICADGGANRLYDQLPGWLPGAEPRAAREAHLPDLIKGDLDSVRADVRAFYADRGVPFVDLSSDQETTDLEKCLLFLEGRLRTMSGDAAAGAAAAGAAAAGAAAPAGAGAAPVVVVAASAAAAIGAAGGAAGGAPGHGAKAIATAAAARAAAGAALPASSSSVGSAGTTLAAALPDGCSAGGGAAPPTPGAAAEASSGRQQQILAEVLLLRERPEQQQQLQELQLQQQQQEQQQEQQQQLGAPEPPAQAGWPAQRGAGAHAGGGGGGGGQPAAREVHATILASHDGGALPAKRLRQQHIILVMGALGGRLDHTLANLNTLYCYPHLDLTLWGDGNLVRLLRAGRARITPSRAEGPTCGLVPLARPATASSRGLKWDLDDTHMCFRGLLSTSNVIASDTIDVTTDEDLLWITAVTDAPLPPRAVRSHTRSPLLLLARRRRAGGPAMSSAPWIMPDGHHLAWRGRAGEQQEQQRRPRPGQGTSGGKAALWGSLQRSKVAAGSDAEELAELRAIERVGARRRRRWLADKVLRDLAGPLSSAEMQAQFQPAPFGSYPPPSAFARAAAPEHAGLWANFISVDMDKEARALERWEQHNREQAAAAAAAAGGGAGPASHHARQQAAAAAALSKWARVSRGARAALKKANVHSVLELEMQVLSLLEQDDPAAELLLELPDGFARLLVHGLSEFHGLASATSVEAGGKRVAVRRRGGGGGAARPEQPREQPATAAAGGGPADANADAAPAPAPASGGGGGAEWLAQHADVTCSDVLMALAELGGAGFDHAGLQRYMKTHVHGTNSDAVSDDFVLV
ncbi:TPK1 [Scenedesmus sp. PABB004]|nr:TPK1 [Scenedesmus sp. PABB004]